MRITALAVLVIAVAAVFACSSGDSNGGGGSEPGSGGVSETPEYELAVVHTGDSNLPEDDPTVGQFKEALDSLDANCSADSREQVADMAVNTHDQVTELGMGESLLVTIQSLSTFVDDAGPQPETCGVPFAVWVLFGSTDLGEALGIGEPACPTPVPGNPATIGEWTLCEFARCPDAELSDLAGGYRPLC